MAQKLVLVTGGAGFIGSRLCARLISEGNRVISLDNYFAGSRENHVDGVEYRECHTKDIERLVPEKPDLVYHLGEYARVEQSLLEPDVVHDLNILGTAGVVAYWKKRKCKLIYAGSSTKFGDGGHARELTPYASTKARNSELVKEMGEREKLPYAITYFYNVYGPGERAGIYGTVIEAFKQMYLNGEPFTVVAPGTQLRNFTHVDDIVDALILVGENGHGDEYGLGRERGFSILEVAKLFLPAGRQAAGEIVMLPERVGNRMTSALDAKKTISLGWKPKRSLEEYIRDFIAIHPRGQMREKRVLVFSTTFYPTVGPAEEALITLMRKMPDVQFDIVTSAFSHEAREAKTPVQNAHVHHVGRGRPFDKYLLPFLGYRAASALHKKHRYLFAWSLMASYAALAGMFLKRRSGLPLLITLADQNISDLSLPPRLLLKRIVTDADQVYAASALPGHVRRSLGEGDALANQLRLSYAQLLLDRVGRKRKVLAFSLSYFPNHVGGAEVALKEITERIEDIEFHLLTLRYSLDEPAEETMGNVIVHRIGGGSSYAAKMFFILSAARAARALHRRHHFNALWAMMSYMLLPIALARLGLPYALSLQEGDSYHHMFGRVHILPFTMLLRRTIRRSSVVQAISHYLGGWARMLGYRGALEIIPNGVALAHFSRQRNEGELAQARTRLGKQEGDVVLITTSRLVKKNAVDDVLRALPFLPESVRFAILGRGEEERALRALAMHLNITSRVRLLGHVRHADMPAYLQASDIFIRPSRTEGMGASFTEAMAAGLPVIATQEGGIADLLFDAKRNPDTKPTGFAVDKDSPQQIAEVVKDIIAHPEQAKSVVANARAMVERDYDWGTIARAMRERVFEPLFKTGG